MGTKGLDLGLELRSGEVVEYSEPRWYWPTWVIILLGICTLGIFLIFLIPKVLSKRTRLTITNQRVIHISGLITRHQTVLSRERIQDVHLRQGPLASRLNYGDIIIESAGSTVTVTIKNVAKPRVARALLTSGSASA